MKKTILMWLLAVAVGTTAFAKDEEAISQQVLNNFKKEFVNAKEVNWQNTKDFVKATFTLNDQVMFAYYTPDGDLLAITRNISSDKLPISLLTSLKKNYSEYWITDLFEAVTNGSGTYYITLQNADVEVILKSDDFGGWQTFKRSKRA
jgi:hypothetical protein